eukprot:comp23403_c0_seq11/m.38848 comp23403_c0_seq11/g.38848  ORF comp23403_c0_seq11/g.38848 comp23403_c0_seq11/m.38848 type:complete len:120 (-) comp23403_c0_seq11:41-400(-)
MVQAAVQTALSAQLQQAPAPAPKIPANGKTKIELPTGTVSNAVRAHLQDMDQNVLDFTWGKMDKAGKGVFVAAVRKGHMCYTCFLTRVWDCGAGVSVSYSGASVYLLKCIRAQLYGSLP